MQKKLIALAVAGLASTAAFAQSNVNLYGVVDVGYAHLNATGLKSQNAIESGLLGGSRIGFKGAEDLGNGLKAIFTLEYALAVDDNTGVGTTDAVGTTASLASGSVARQQFVGVTGGFGTAVAGRLQTAGYDWACAYNPLGGSGLDTVGKLGAATLLACGNAGRASNAVAYISPSFSGLTVALNHARVTENTNVPLGTGKDSYATLLGVNYANGPIGAGLVYNRVNAGATAVSDNTTEWGLGGSYDFGVAKLFATYQRNKVEGVSANNKYSLAASVPVASVGTVVASYAKNNIKSTSASDNGTAYGVAYLHGLSKRTTVYTGYTRVTNTGDNVTGGTFGYNAGGYLPTAGGNVGVFALGVNHKF